jgi:hypothetical protein
MKPPFLIRIIPFLRGKYIDAYLYSGDIRLPLIVAHPPSTQKVNLNSGPGHLFGYIRHFLFH